MLIKCRKQKDINIVTVYLERATLKAAPYFKETLNKIIENNCSKIIVNFSEVDFIDSTFLGVIVSTYKKSAKLNGNLILVWPEDKYSPVMTQTNLHRVFRIYRNLENAIEHFNETKEQNPRIHSS
jgi:anti-anti-sigma factor